MSEGEIQLFKETNGIAVLKIRGGFTKETSPAFQGVCDEVVKNDAIRGVLLDFKDVSNVDSSAFACMIDFIGEHAKDKIKIGIVHLGQQANELLEILKIHPYIKVYDNEAEGASLLLK